MPKVLFQYQDLVQLPCQKAVPECRSAAVPQSRLVDLHGFLKTQFVSSWFKYPNSNVTQLQTGANYQVLVLVPDDGELGQVEILTIFISGTEQHCHLEVLAPFCSNSFVRGFCQQLQLSDCLLQSVGVCSKTSDAIGLSCHPSLSFVQFFQKHKHD